VRHKWLLPAFACALIMSLTLRPALACRRHAKPPATEHAEGCALIAMAEKVKAKADRPETLTQAIEWQTVKNHYVKLGLCHVCAAQAAYGHQIGFTRINQPCAVCATVVAGLPDEAANGWRSQSYRKTGQGAYGLVPEREAYRSASWPTVRAHTPRRVVSRGTRGPMSWEPCYRPGGPREGLYEDDHAAFTAEHALIGE
jgi:hypothetical protein